MVPSTSIGVPGVILAAIALLSCALLVSAQSGCNQTLLYQETPRQYVSCSNLPAQDASIAWNYVPDTNVLEVAFVGFAPKEGGWVAWGINPTGLRMVGTNALIGFSTWNGSIVLPYKLTTSQLMEKPLVSSPIDLNITETSVQISGLKVTIFATVQLKAGETELNQVWNAGPSVTDNVPEGHDLDTTHLQGVATLDVQLGTVRAAEVAPSHKSQKNVHGILCGIGWGIVLPLGIVAARYLRPFTVLEPYWMKIHGALQLTGYIVGVAGWALGLKLDSYTAGTIYTKHKNLGLAIFAVATLQIMTLTAKPDNKHKFRFCWNMLHHILGYTVVFLSIGNIFEGLGILKPAQGWKRAYVGFLVVVGILVFIMEVITWVMYFMKSEDAAAHGRSADSATDEQSTGRGIGHFLRRRSEPKLEVDTGDKEMAEK